MKVSRKVHIPIGLVIVTALFLGGWLIFGVRPNNKNRVLGSSSPVPAAIKSGVSFPVYFPDTSKLPGGYSLDENSFSEGAGAVEFVVNHGNQKLIFTEQTKPSPQDLQTFLANRLPLHTNIQTSIGTANVGAIGNNALVSLPTNSTTWILVSAPYSIDQSQLTSVLKSLQQ